MTRSEFCDYVLKEFRHSWSLTNLQEGMPIWIPEERAGWKASYFAVTPCLDIVSKHHEDVSEFWEWCRLHLSRTPMCYMSNSQRNQEWWGFNTEQDQLLFTLKWVR